MDAADLFWIRNRYRHLKWSAPVLNHLLFLPKAGSVSQEIRLMLNNVTHIYTLTNRAQPRIEKQETKSLSSASATKTWEQLVQSVNIIISFHHTDLSSSRSSSCHHSRFSYFSRSPFFFCSARDEKVPIVSAIFCIIKFSTAKPSEPSDHLFASYIRSLSVWTQPLSVFFLSHQFLLNLF